METRNDLDYANSQPNENELEKERLVTISNRSVYHKYAEVTIPIPKHIKQEDVAEWLFENENLYIDDLATMYVIGTTLNYETDLFGSILKLDNPNVASSCGCGESFSF